MDEKLWFSYIEDKEVHRKDKKHLYNLRFSFSSLDQKNIPNLNLLILLCLYRIRTLGT